MPIVRSVGRAWGLRRAASASLCGGTLVGACGFLGVEQLPLPTEDDGDASVSDASGDDQDALAHEGGSGAEQPADGGGAVSDGGPGDADACGAGYAGRHP